MSKSILDTPLYNFMRYLYYFLIINFYFIICNVLFVIVFLTIDLKIENILIYFIALIPLGPATSALFYTLDKIIKGRDLKPTYTFFHAYKTTFLMTLKVWIVLLTVMFILLIDISYSINNANLFSLVFLFLIFFSICHALFAFPLISRFDTKFKDIMIFALYSIFKFPKTTLLNGTTLMSLGFIYYTYPALSSLFIFSVGGFFVMYNIQTPLKQLEENFI